MGKFLQGLAAAVLMAVAPLAASADTNLNLDAGTTGGAGTGDITFTGSSLAVVGSATQAPIGLIGPTLFAFEYNQGVASVALLESEQGLYSTAPITSALNFAANYVVAVHTNAGNYAAVLVTALSSTSITLQYLTYNISGTLLHSGTVTLGAGSGSGPAAPVITVVQNNYSFVLPNAPNYGIAPGTLVLIQGTGLTTPGSAAAPLQDPTKALPTSLHGSTVTLTIGGTAVNPAFYYACDGHVCNPTTNLDLLAVVIPSSAPTGAGTMTVSYNNQTSAAFPITIVPHAFGFDYYGGALAAVTDNADGHLITTANSAKPGEQIVLWGAGDGADTNDDDVNPPKHFDNLSGITALYFGGVQVPVEYQGRSSYQGVDQINVQVPANAPTGCAVSVVAVSGSGASALASNIVAMPIAANGGTCSDPLALVSPSQVSSLSGLTRVRLGSVEIGESNDGGMETDTAGAVFESIDGSLLAGYLSSKQPSSGSCFVTQSDSSTPVSLFTYTGLDAGTVSVAGPAGTQQLSTIPGEPGIYTALQLPTGFVSSGGTFTFTGAGGADVGPFSEAVSFTNPLVWTNPGSDGTISRASGVTVNWTGGAGGTFVQIYGYAASADFSASFVCNVPVSPGTYTVPPAVLLALPAGDGALLVSNYTNPQPFSSTPSGLDFAYGIGVSSSDISATYQ